MRKADNSWLHSLLVALCLLAFFTGCNDPQKAKQKYFESGQRYFDKGQFAEAQLQFKNATVKDPNFGEGYFKLAMTDFKLGQVNDAYQDFSKAIQLEPDNYAARLEFAKFLNMFHRYSEAKEQLDQFVSQHSSAKRYFITIEGYTDKTGTKSYNDALSRRRAEHVMAYLITQHNIPVFRIQDIGLGNEKPADTGRNRAARAKNRRVEIRLFTADTNLAMTQSGQSAQAK